MPSNKDKPQAVASSEQQTAVALAYLLLLPLELFEKIIDYLDDADKFSLSHSGRSLYNYFNFTQPWLKDYSKFVFLMRLIHPSPNSYEEGVLMRNQSLKKLDQKDLPRGFFGLMKKDCENLKRTYRFHADSTSKKLLSFYNDHTIKVEKHGVVHTTNQIDVAKFKATKTNFEQFSIFNKSIIMPARLLLRLEKCRLYSVRKEWYPTHGYARFPVKRHEVFLHTPESIKSVRLNAMRVVSFVVVPDSEFNEQNVYKRKTDFRHLYANYGRGLRHIGEGPCTYSIDPSWRMMSWELRQDSPVVNQYRQKEYDHLITGSRKVSLEQYLKNHVSELRDLLNYKPKALTPQA